LHTSEFKKLKVLLDSKTFGDLLKSGDRVALALLAQANSGLLEFIRSPSATSNNELEKIRSFELHRKEAEIEGIEIRSDKYASKILFGYKMEDIKMIAKEIYGGNPMSDEELENVVYVFVQKVFIELHESDLFITNNKSLLKKRDWLETHFPGGPLYIVSLEEGSMFIDYFFKKNDHYFLNPYMGLQGSWYWYWLSMRLKLTRYNVGDQMLDAMAYRFCYCLMALDQIALQFYSGPSNDTKDRTVYHFNYLITLITGVFDNLALKTNSSLGINIENLPRVSLSNVSGLDFLKEIRSKNNSLRDHIAAYMNFIMLIYSFRDLVVHREGLAKTSFEYRGEDARWRVNVVKLDKNQIYKVEECHRWGNPSNWGVFATFLEPFAFSVTALTVLMEFVDEYLGLLGQPSFVEAQRTRKEDPFTKDLLDFEKYHLGF
jgi:hypothetical protein